MKLANIKKFHEGAQEFKIPVPSLKTSNVNNLENLKLGLENFTKIINEMDDKTGLVEIMNVYGNLSVLIYRASQSDLYNEIVYPAQSLQTKVHKKIEINLKKNKLKTC